MSTKPSKLNRFNVVPIATAVARPRCTTVRVFGVRVSGHGMGSVPTRSAHLERAEQATADSVAIAWTLWLFRVSCFIGRFSFLSNSSSGESFGVKHARVSFTLSFMPLRRRLASLASLCLALTACNNPPPATDAGSDGGGDDATIDDSLPLTVEHLTHSDLGRELLDAARQGTAALPWALQAALRPDLPPGELAKAAIDSANKVVGSILTKFATVAGTTPSLGAPLPIDLVLQPGAGHHFPVGTVLFGTVSGVVQHPTDPARKAITSLRFTKLRPSMRLGLAQLNTTVGDLAGNRSRILEAYAKLAAQGTSESRELRERLMEHASIAHSIGNLRTFPFVQDAIAEGRLHLHGGYFDIATGQLQILDPGSGSFEKIS